MGQKKLENYFINPRLEYHNIINDLKSFLKKEVYEEIIALVEMKTEEAMNQVWQRLRNRYEELSRLEDSMPDQPTKEDQNHYLQEFFKLSDPSKVSKDLQNALKFHQFENEYHEFIDRMTTQEYGEIFHKYRYPSSFFNQMRHAILYNIDGVTNSLKNYTEAIGKHAIVLDSVKNGKKGKALIKGGASLLGMMIGVPFMGMGVGALMGNDTSRINDSLNKVFKNWNTYIDQFNQFVKSLEDSYSLAMMTIYGGTILRVNEQLNAFQFTFQEMALLSGHYSLTITPKEKKETEKWVKETTNGIKQLLKQKQWKQALHVSKEFFQIVKSRPITARTELYDGKSTLYIAHLYYYVAFQESLLEEGKNGHHEQFYTVTKKLYEDLPLIVHDMDIDAEFSKQGHLLFRFVKEALKRGEENDLYAVPHYLERVVERWEKDGIYVGENYNTFEEYVDDLKAYYIVELFLEKVLGLKIEKTEADKEVKIRLNLKQLKAIQKIDSEIGNPDQFTQYLKSQYWKTLLFPWYNSSVMKHKKKLASIVAAASIILGGLTYGEDFYHFSKNKVASLKWFHKTEEVQKSVPTAKPSITYLKINTEYANVRSIPSLNGKVVYSLKQTETLQFLNKEEADQEGRTCF